MQIPYDKLSPEALQTLIKIFISSAGDDAGDIPIQDKIDYIMGHLKKGEAVITFDEKTETCNILLKKDYDRLMT